MRDIHLGRGHDGNKEEAACHLINCPGPSMSDNAEYIVVNDYSPSIVKVDSVESNHSSRE